MTIEQDIYKQLQESFQPEMLNVINESHLHHGHAGDDGSGQSHFKIEIKSEKFANLSAVARERLVHQALAEQIKVIHALSIKFIK